MHRATHRIASSGGVDLGDDLLGGGGGGEEASQLCATPSSNALMCSSTHASCRQFLPLCAHKDICHSSKSSCSHFDAQP